MTREQAINYLICRGITEYQVSEIVRALTYKPRDCANCKHYIVKDTRTNWGSQETTKIYGCERWGCEYEPTTKNDLGVEKIVDVLGSYTDLDIPYKHKIAEDILNNLPSVTPQLSIPEVTALAEWTEKLTKECEEAYNKGYADGMKAQEPRKGHWVYDYTSADGRRTYHCSECGCFLKPKHSEPLNSFNWCSLCGADMREVKE